MIPDDRDSPRPPPALATLEAQAAAVGLSVRGAFHPSGEAAELLAGFSPTPETCVLLGFTGGQQWHYFAASAEAADGNPDPLDRWSRRLIGALAREYGAAELYPGTAPCVPFQRLAARAEAVHPSPIGLLVHSRWGPWHAYRGALLFGEHIEVPVWQESTSPCAACRGQPCRSACPVEAFGAGVFALDACVAHVTSAAGSECRERGCRARRACPVGVEYAYPVEQMRFHMRAFIHAVTR